MSRSRRRYRDLKAQLQKRSPGALEARHDDALGKVLDDVNAWGVLETQREAHHAKITCFGPGIFRGYLPLAWAGVGLWYKQRGYYFYDTIQLVGIWALRQTEQQIEMVIGTRDLHYALPFFNPESYYRLIQDEFRTLYKDNGSPPTAETCRYTTAYDPERRLDIRREIEDQLDEWAYEQNPPKLPW
jgi:hypothetical protein